MDPSQNLASQDLIEKLLAYLKPDDRLLMKLLHLEGRSVEEIRHITGWNVSLIKVRAFRARNRLKGHLADLMKEGDK